MFTRQQQKHIRRLVTAAIWAFALNAVYPSGAHAQSVSRSDQTVISNAVMADPHPIVKPIAAAIIHLTVPTDKPVARKMTLRASAYSSTVDQCDSDPFTTASGTKVHEGTIAMNGLPFGTKIRIPAHYGDKIFTVEDRMNAKWGSKRLDIWMPTRNDAQQWGVRTITIEILS